MISEESIIPEIYRNMAINGFQGHNLKEAMDIFFQNMEPFIPAKFMACYAINRNEGRVTVLATAGDDEGLAPVQNQSISLVPPSYSRQFFCDFENSVMLWDDYRQDPVAKTHFEPLYPDFHARLGIQLGEELTNGGLGLLLLSDVVGAFDASHARLLATLRPFLHELTHTLFFAHLTPAQNLTFSDDQTATGIEILRRCKGLSPVFRKVETVAPTEAMVLLQGENGVGKELIARNIHRLSRYASGPFVPIHCGMLPKKLIDNILFGSLSAPMAADEASFHGSESLLPLTMPGGYIARARSGTLFLDEIDELPPYVQSRLLRLLEYDENQRLRGAPEKGMQVRILAATKHDLRALVRTGVFREDLWYRLSMFPIDIPPLCRRREDIPTMIEYFRHMAALQLGLEDKYTIPPFVMTSMLTARWPGNSRQLQHVIERAILQARMAGRHELLIDLEDDLVPDVMTVCPTSTPSEHGMRHQSSGAWAVTPDGMLASLPDETREATQSLDVINETYIIKALERCKGRVSGVHGAAQLLNIHPNTLRSRMQKLSIDPKRYAPPKHVASPEMRGKMKRGRKPRVAPQN